MPADVRTLIRKNSIGLYSVMTELCSIVAINLGYTLSPMAMQWGTPGLEGVRINLKHRTFILIGVI